MKVFIFRMKKKRRSVSTGVENQAVCISTRRRRRKKKEGGTKASALKVTSSRVGRLLERSKCSLEKHIHTHKGGGISPPSQLRPYTYVRPPVRPSTIHTQS